MMIVKSSASVWRLRASARGLWDSRPLQVRSYGGYVLCQAGDGTAIGQAHALTMESRVI